MAASRQAWLIVLAAIVLGFSLTSGRLTAGAGPPAPGEISAQALGASLGFAPAVAQGDRDAVLAAVAAARPEARSLIERVDGLVKVVVGPTGTDAVGRTEGNRSGYTVTLDLATVSHASGARGVSRLVLHELGHVVDHALLDAARQRALDAGIPMGYACRPGEPTGACATREERFAETFAKWAANDIGINVELGYKVLPPADLDAWGAGLAAL